MLDSSNGLNLFAKENLETMFLHYCMLLIKNHEYTVIFLIFTFSLIISMNIFPENAFWVPEEHLINKSNMQRILILMTIIVSIRSIFISASILEENTATASPQIESGSSYDDEYDNESARKIIGSR